MKHANLPHNLLIRVTLILVGFAILIGSDTHAQTKESGNKEYYGFEASASLQSFQLTSNIASLSDIKIDQRGASIGLVFGDQFWKAKIKPIGFYNSNSASQTSVKVIESGAHINFYPIKIITGKSSRLPSLYVTGGLSRGRFQINGKFLPEGQQSTCPADNETFSGRVVSWNVMGGVGLEYQVTHGQEFITLFAEMKKGISAGNSSNQDLFKNTSVSNFAIVNVGFNILIH